MIIIADSGSSKIEWRLLKGNGEIKQAHTSGFNPYYQPIDDLDASIQAFLPEVDEEVKRIFYYGTGVSSEKNQNVIKDSFAKYFGKAHTEISWDLLAAARALCGEEPGIACIIGTGSNSCLYNGKEITYVVANLGWILADEASGTNIGRKFLFDYLRLKQPASVSEAFKKRFPFTREEFLEKVYQQEKPAAFLASFTKFIFQHLKEPYCYQLIYNSFVQFFEEVVMRYENYQQYKVHFTGSVAFYFSDILRQVAADKGITVKNIMEGPIAGLTLYHKKDL